MLSCLFLEGNWRTVSGVVVRPAPKPDGEEIKVPAEPGVACCIVMLLRGGVELP